MLGGGHKPGIYRDIRIDLDAADAEPQGFEQLQAPGAIRDYADHGARQKRWGAGA